MKKGEKMLKKIGVLALFLVTLAGCGGGENGVGGGMSADEKIAEKLNNYLLCTNNFSGDVLDSQENYLEDVGDPMLPTEEIDGVYLWPIEKDIESCAAKIQIANAINIENQLNPLANEYLEALTAVKPLIKKADRYYDQEDYLDDDFAEAKQMHEPLIQAFTQFEQAHRALKDELNAIGHALDERLMNQLKEGGNQLGYLDKKGIMEAKELFKIGYVENSEDFDLDQYETVLETYELTVDEMVNYEGYNEYHDEFLAEAKGLMRTKKEVDQEEDEFWSSHDFDSATSDLESAYDDLVNGPSGMIIGPDGVQIN